MFDAIILDLDGVVTRTADVHAFAWQQMFDDYLKQRAETHGELFLAFNPKTDYRLYVDGRPRFDGVRFFLAARGIDLPYGQETDPISRETICGLGNRKNEVFLELVDSRGVTVFEDAVERIREWRNAGLKTAIVTSSRNGTQILRKSGLEELFDVSVDGMLSSELKLPGKPAPDTFLEAARRLGVEPGRAVVVEDAISGVRAGVAGKFGLVVGVARDDGWAALAEAGADLVVSDLRSLRLEGVPSRGPHKMRNAYLDLPDALESFATFTASLADRKPAFFLDFDGTLAPIVRRPEEAILSRDLRESLRELASDRLVAIVSDRDRADVQEKVGLDGLIYAGSHGMDIIGPQGQKLVHEKASALLADIAEAEQALRSRLAAVEGAQIERKRFAVAIHFRNVRDEYIPEVEAAVKEVHARWPTLRRTGGKKVFELRPDIAWDKGRAVMWLLDTLDQRRSDVVPVYFGDDLTDEAAFRALSGIGVTVLVGDHGHPTAARFRLAGPPEVHQLLERMRSGGCGK